MSDGEWTDQDAQYTETADAGETVEAPAESGGVLSELWDTAGEIVSGLGSAVAGDFDIVAAGVDHVLGDSAGAQANWDAALQHADDAQGHFDEAAGHLDTVFHDVGLLNEAGGE